MGEMETFEQMFRMFLCCLFSLSYIIGDFVGQECNKKRKTSDSSNVFKIKEMIENGLFHMSHHQIKGMDLFIIILSKTKLL